MKSRAAAGGDLWAGLGLIIVGAIFVYSAFEIKRPPFLSDSLGPQAFPMGLSVALVLLGSIMTLRALLRGGPPVDPGPRATLAVLMGSTVAYVVAFQPLGYVISTTLFMGFLFRYLGERRLWLAILAAVGVALVLVGGFGEGLHVRLPKGPFGF